MKFLINRVLPFVCALSILFSLCVVPVSAAWSSGDVADMDSVVDWEAKLIRPANLEVYGEFLGLGASATVGDVFWSFVNRVINDGGVGEVGVDGLSKLCSLYNSYFNRPLGETFSEQLLLGSQDIANNLLAQSLFGKMSLTFELKEWGTSGYIRIYCPDLDAWVVTSNGRYAYAVSHRVDTSGGNQWIGETTAADRAKKEVAIHSLDRLNMMCNTLRENGIPAQIKSLSSNFKCIWYNRMVYADSEGVPFLSWVDPEQSATNQDRVPTNATENGDIIEGDLTDNSVNIDMDGMTITLPDGSINFIDKIIYDESTKSYHIDSHDTYNYTTNNYYTWNYYINYTSITYIGQTEEYNKYYEVYYELPDGRDSADLTKEDLEQLNLSVDVIPYGRSADDTSLRSLYHFDGDTKDSSYWNYCTDFTWNKGASLTYMDAGVFDGALYLDENEHEFAITLPSVIGTGDFTLQFRYYQSATAAPVSDSEITIGTYKVLGLNGSTMSSTKSTVIPVGTWNELCLVRKGDAWCWWLNGVPAESGTGWTTFLDGRVTFKFGNQQQTFKYIDELRVLDFAAYEPAKNYTPTAVPYDTNLTLVLPDTAAPVADEYWSITSSGDNIFNYTLEQFTSGSAPSWYDGDKSLPTGFQKLGNWVSCDVGQLNSTIRGSLTAYSGFLRFTNTGYGNVSFTPNGNGGCNASFHTTIRNGSGSSVTYLTPNQSYVFSIVLSDGTVVSAPFVYGSSSNVKITGDWGDMGYMYGDKYLYYLYINPKANSYVDIMYMELVEGTSTDLTAEWVESVTAIDRDDLNTPTLAVRTDIDITSYQIGGVRPSIPEKGHVWAMVENDRIVSIQIYNGQAWEGVDGRIWTGQRWIPASSYNIITLQDMYDIVDATPNYEYIYSEAGFWAWWQKSWNAFTEKLFQALGSGGSGSGSIVPGTVKQKVSEALSSLIEGIFGTITEVLKSLIGAASDLLSGIFSFFSDTVFGGIRDFFSSFDELINPFETTIENEDGSTTTSPGLPDDVVTGLGFFSGLIMLIPDEVRVVLFFFAGLTLFIAILKRFA